MNKYFDKKKAINDQQISYPLPKDKREIAKLWQISFNDSAEYIELFFDRVYKPENTLVIKRNGLIASTLQMVPYQAKIGDEIVPFAYICGACTHPLERGKGLMKSLLDHAKRKMKRQGYHFSIVIPAEPSLFNFYRDLGFTSLISHVIEKRSFNVCLSNEAEKKSDYSFEACTSNHFPYFDRNQNECQQTILHDDYDFETILQELNCCDDKAIVALKDNTTVGMAFAEKNSADTNTPLIKKIFADNEEVQNALCRHIAKVFDNQEVIVHFPLQHHSPTTDTNAYGLACNLNGKNRVLNLFNMSLMHD